MFFQIQMLMFQRELINSNIWWNWQKQTNLVSTNCGQMQNLRVEQLLRNMDGEPVFSNLLFQPTFFLPVIYASTKVVSGIFRYHFINMPFFCRFKCFQISWLSLEIYDRNPFEFLILYFFLISDVEMDDYILYLSGDKFPPDAQSSLSGKRHTSRICYMPHGVSEEGLQGKNI